MVGTFAELRKLYGYEEQPATQSQHSERRRNAVRRHFFDERDPLVLDVVNAVGDHYYLAFFSV